LSSSTGPLLVTGTVTLDTLHLPHGTYHGVPGGSALFGAMGAAMVRPCHLVGTAGADLPVNGLAPLVDRGVDIGGLARKPGSTFSWEARYSEDLGHRNTVDRRPGVGSVPPEVPSRLCDARAWVFLGSMDPQIQRSVLEQIGPGVRYGLDTMTHWIAESRREVLALVKDADTVFVSTAEGVLLGEQGTAADAASALLAAGAGHVVVKGGASGVHLYGHDDLRVHCPAVSIEQVVDPTGGGDSLGGAFMAARSKSFAAVEALAYGAAAASFAVEDVSFKGFARAVDGEFERRVEWATQRWTSRTH